LEKNFGISQPLNQSFDFGRKFFFLLWNKSTWRTTKSINLF